MRIGLAYDLKEVINPEADGPEDALEEYDSGETIDLISTAFKSAGHSVVNMGGGSDFLLNILRERVDLVFNIAEGRGNYRSREAQVPSVLEMLDIPYSGSDPQCLAICLDKPLTKQLIKAAGVPTPAWHVIDTPEHLSAVSWNGLAYPAIIKPAYEGSSKGIHVGSLVSNPEEAVEVVGRLLKCYRQPMMLEEFIPGDEVTVGVVGNTPPAVLGMMRIVPKKKVDHFVYSLEVKRDYLNLVDYECPARLEEDVLAEIAASSLKAFSVLGCRDFARLDFRVGPDRIPYFIEVNPLPGLGTYSDLIIMALKLGWRYEELIDTILRAVVKRYPQCVLAR
ncbi:MAG: ATP-grasp domain-containing protein [Dehalococcoidales bacterium]|nr:ATP-grasp domain-containing protein [Dehalococcoidales bacterium]